MSALEKLSPAQIRLLGLMQVITELDGPCQAEPIATALEALRRPGKADYLYNRPAVLSEGLVGWVRLDLIFLRNFFCLERHSARGYELTDLGRQALLEVGGPQPEWYRPVAEKVIELNLRSEARRPSEKAPRSRV